MLGFYIHVLLPRQVPYCDFYSRPDSPGRWTAYVSAVDGRPRPLAGEAPGPGNRHGVLWRGHPQPAGDPALGAILDAVREGFSLAPGAEITLEANPTHVDRAFFQEARRAGFNRLSMGLQSANGEELRFLGRAHSPQQAAQLWKTHGPGALKTSPWT